MSSNIMPTTKGEHIASIRGTPNLLGSGTSQHSRPSSQPSAEPRHDIALDFLTQHKEAAATVEISELSHLTKRLRIQIDRRLIPFFCLCYAMNFLDKVLLNVRSPYPQGYGSSLNTACSMPTSWGCPSSFTSLGASTPMRLRRFTSRCWSSRWRTCGC